MEINGKSMKINGNQWNSTEINEQNSANRTHLNVLVDAAPVGCTLQSDTSADPGAAPVSSRRGPWPRCASMDNL